MHGRPVLPDTRMDPVKARALTPFGVLRKAWAIMANEGISPGDREWLQPTPSPDGGFDRVTQGVILVIDDETQILDSMRRTLIREGWVVLTASDPAEGMQLYGEYWQAISLVLLDYFLPDKRGDQVWECLRTINPQARVLWMSASDDYIPPEMLNSGLCGFMMKPVTRKELFRGIRKVLKSGGPPDPASDGQSA